jgi:two-component system cell cycle response regulator
MIVDDDVTNRELLQIVFERFGFGVINASSGPQALKLAETEKPSAIVCDVRMAGMDGYEVCAQLKANPVTNAIPVVMLTAYESDAERQKAVDAGADDFIPRMQGWQKLVERIKGLLPA